VPVDPDAVAVVSVLGWQAFGFMLWMYWRERNRRYRKEHDPQRHDDEDDVW